MADVEKQGMTTRQVLVSAVILGLTCALVVWWLEDWNRQRMAADWKQFIDGWQSKASSDG